MSNLFVVFLFLWGIKTVYVGERIPNFNVDSSVGEIIEYTVPYDAFRSDVPIDVLCETEVPGVNISYTDYSFMTTFKTHREMKGVLFKDDLIYISAYQRMFVFNESSPGNFSLVGFAATTSYMGRIHDLGDYILSWDSSFTVVFDVKGENRTNPVEIFRENFGISPPRSSIRIGNFIYCVRDANFYLINVENPAKPSHNKTISLPGSYDPMITRDDKYLYISQRDQGIRLYDFSKHPPEFKEGMGASGVDLRKIMVRGDFLYASIGLTRTVNVYTKTALGLVLQQVIPDMDYYARNAELQTPTKFFWLGKDGFHAFDATNSTRPKETAFIRKDTGTYSDYSASQNSRYLVIGLNPHVRRSLALATKGLWVYKVPQMKVTVNTTFFKGRYTDDGSKTITIKGVDRWNNTASQDVQITWKGFKKHDNNDDDSSEALEAYAMGLFLILMIAILL